MSDTAEPPYLLVSLISRVPLGSLALARRSNQTSKNKPA
jgi:hypothetical protein